LAVLALANERLTRAPQQAAAVAAESAQRLAEESRRQAASALALGMEPNLRAMWDAMVKEAVSLSTGVADRLGAFSAVSRTARLLTQSGILAAGAYLAINQQITAGAMIAASILLARALSPVEQAISHWRGVLNMTRSWRRIAQTLDTGETAKAVPIQLPPLTGTL